MPERSLTVHNANITTASVEISTLTISGKQVTLAVYRQLPVAALVDWKNCRLHGVPWGRVNYHAPKSCPTGAFGEEIDHWHIVWQLGNSLYRSAVRNNRWRMTEVVDPRDRVAYYEMSPEQVAEYERIAAERNQLIDSLAELPQLFIAV